MPRARWSSASARSCAARDGVHHAGHEQAAGEPGLGPRRRPQVDGPAGAREPSGEILHPYRRPCSLDEGLRLDRAIARFASQAQEIVRLALRLRVVAHRVEKIRAGAADRQPLADRHPALAELVGRRPGLLVEHERVSQRVGLDRLRAGGEELGQRLVPDLGSREVMREDRVMLGDPVGVQLLDGATDAVVQLLPALPQQRVVRHVLGQGMPERVGRLGNALRLADQLDGLELAQGRVE